jgi:hypothetical protein
MAAVAAGPRTATEGEGSMLVDNISSEGIKRVVLSLLMTLKRIECASDKGERKNKDWWRLASG